MKFINNQLTPSLLNEGLVHFKIDEQSNKLRGRSWDTYFSYMSRIGINKHIDPKLKFLKEKRNYSFWDIGCGEGKALSQFSEKANKSLCNINAIGFDLLKPNQYKEIDYHQNFRFINCDIEEINLERYGNSDLITIIGVLPYLKDPIKTIIKYSDCLSKYGILYLDFITSINILDEGKSILFIDFISKYCKADNIFINFYETDKFGLLNDGKNKDELNKLLSNLNLLNSDCPNKGIEDTKKFTYIYNNN